MAASIASSAFLPASPAPASAFKNAPRDPPDSLDVRGVAAKTGAPAAAVRAARARVQAVPKVNGGKAAVADGEDEAVRSSVAPRTFYNQLPDWSMLLAAITTIFLAAERQWTLLDWKPKRPDMLTDTFGFGRIIQDGLVFRQDFSIRSYEIGADRTVSIETLMNHLQETALNHVKSAGLLGDGFGSTPEMSKRNLFWVVSQMQVLVEHKWVMMHKLTRKLSRIPDEVRTEIRPYFFEHTAIVDEDNRKIPKLPEHCGATAMKYVRMGLTPRWADLDINQHVNNVKYIGWILESAPISIFENHELASMVLDYKRECGRDSVLQSHTTVFTDCTDESGETILQCEHLLSLESGPTVVKARTMWRPKRAKAQETVTPLSVASA